jgi:cell wall-associated NlpC family hydrolase/biotin carboxyl carrier protein
MDKKTPAWLLVIPVAFFLTVMFGLILLGANKPYVPDTSGDDSCYGAVTGSQKEYVQTVIGVAKSMGVNEDGQIVAVMVMLQESGIKNYANDGANALGYDGFPPPGATFWLNMAKLSMNMPHDAVGHDADSVGLFQQRASAGWANTGGFTASDNPAQAISRLMNPAFSAARFFDHLKSIPGWQSMARNDAAQQVQGSATPDAYGKWDAQATALVQQNSDVSAVAPGSGSDGGTADAAAAASLTYQMPIDQGLYKLGQKFGPGHNGQDFLAGKGTPIKAIADGTVSAAGGADDTMGNWIVIDHKIGQEGGKDVTISSVYGDMSKDSIAVKVGDSVTKGQTIAEVGQEGDAKQPQLHFEIWAGGRFNSGDHQPVDPMTVLQSDPAATGCGDTVSGTAGAMIDAGKKWLGTPYSWGGGSLTGPSEGFAQGAGIVGFDCSGLVRYMVYQGTHHELPRTADAQYAATKSNEVGKAGITASQLQPGDLLFWGATAASIHHVAMYVGNGKMIEAPQTGEVVRITDVRLSGDFYAATRLNFKQ